MLYIYIIYRQGERLEVQRYLQESTQEILLLYAKVVTSLVKTLKQSNVQVKIIRDIVAEKHSCSCAKVCDETTDMTKLFQLLNKRGCLTFFNHALLEEIINRLGDGKCELTLKQFKGKFQTYCKRRVIESPRAFWPELGLEQEGSNNEMVEIVFKIDDCFDTLSMKKLATFSELVARALGIDKSTLHLKSIQEGCIMISYLLPFQDINKEKLFSLLWNKMQKSMQDMKLLSVEMIFNSNWHSWTNCNPILAELPNSTGKEYMHQLLKQNSRA